MRSPKGLFCGNYGAKRTGLSVCHRSWCSSCYVADGSLQFHIDDATTDAGAVWKRKKDEGRFLSARDGDMWSSPFQCEWCWIGNLKGRDMNERDPKDALLLKYLQRMNLDVMWSRERSTVKGTYYQLIKGARHSEKLGLDPINLDRGPWPIQDDQGVQVALEILSASREPGKHRKSYQQFETIRKLRSAFSNAFETGPRGVNQGNLVFREKGKAYGLRVAPTESILFTKFMQGLVSRMGQVIIPDEAISNEQMHGIMSLIHEKLSSSSATVDVKRKWTMAGAFFMLLYGCSLRGHEGLFLEGSDFVRLIQEGKEGILDHVGKLKAEGHVCAPLLGRFKSEVGEQRHVMVMVNVSKSGLKFREWMERLAALLKAEGREEVAGPAFCHKNGDMIMSYQMNEILHAVIEELAVLRPDLFLNRTDVASAYGISRSFRRGANSRATEEGVKKEYRDLINRWSSFELKKGKRPHLSMTQHYLEIRLVARRILVYSKSL